MLIFMEEKHIESFYAQYKRVYIYEEMLMTETRKGLSHGLG